jgi:nucleoporin GLE1
MGHADGLGHVLMSRLVKKCCWVVPFYPARKEGESEAEWRKTVGHLADSGGGGETKEGYGNRMVGILTLYLAICSIPPTPSLLPTPAPPGHPPYPTFSPSLIPQPFRLPTLWTWTAALTRPSLAQLEITPLLLAAMLDTAGGKLVGTYGKQWVKLLRVLQRGLKQGEVGLGGGSVKNRSGVERLNLVLEGWERNGWRPEVEKERSNGQFFDRD